METVLTFCRIVNEQNLFNKVI